MLNLFSSIRDRLNNFAHNSINTFSNTAKTGFRNVINVFKNDPEDFMKRVVGIVRDKKSHNVAGVLNEVSSMLNNDFST